MSITDRLNKRALVLMVITKQREMFGDQTIGSGIEKQILDRELNDLEICTAMDELDGEIRRICEAAA